MVAMVTFYICKSLDVGIEVDTESRQKSFTTQAAEYGFVIDKDDMTRTY
jgi:hypothetical protein